MQILLRRRPLRARIEATWRESNLTSTKIHFWWGMLNVYAAFWVNFMSFVFGLVGFQKFIYASMAAWFVIGWKTRRVPFRMPLAVAVMLLLQIWFGICTIHGQLAVGMLTPWTAMDIMWITYVIGFMQAAGLVWMAPEARRMLLIPILTFCIASAFIALLQFFNVGWAEQLGGIAKQADQFSYQTEIEIVRAQGIQTGIGASVSYGCMVPLAIAAFWDYRRIRWYDAVAVGLLVLSSLIVQVRNQLPVILIIICWLAIIVYRRYRTAGLSFIVGGVAAIGVFIALKQETFGYFLEGNNGTLLYRQWYLWPQAIHVMRLEPIFGIGVEPAFASWSTQIFPNRFMEVPLMDSGYYLIGLFAGYPGIALLVLLQVCALIGTVRLLREPSEDVYHLAFKRLLFVALLFYLFGLPWGSLWSNPVVTAFYITIGGFALPSKKSLSRSGSPFWTPEASTTEMPRL